MPPKDRRRCTQPAKEKVEAKKKKRKVEAHPERECSEICGRPDCASNLKVESRVYHLKVWSEEKRGYAIEAFSLKADACICNKCNLHISKCFNKPGEKSTPEPSQTKQGNKQPCFLSTFDMCENLSQHKTTPGDWLTFVSVMGLHVIQPVKVNNIELCKDHYRRWQEVGSKCPSCYRRFRHVSSGKKWSIPSIEQVKAFYQELGQTWTQKDDDKVCQTCFNDFRTLVRRMQRDASIEGKLSTDQELNGLNVRYQSLATSEPSIDNLSDHAVHYAVLATIQLLKSRQPFLLGEVYCKYTAALDELLQKYNPQTSPKPCMKSTILIKILACLDVHVRYSTVKNHPSLGTMMWRSGDNVVDMLHRSLHKQRSSQSKAPTAPLQENPQDNEEDILVKAAIHLQSVLRDVSKQFISHSRLQDFDTFNVENLVQTIPPSLWNFLVILTEDDKGRRDRMKAMKGKSLLCHHYLPDDSTDHIRRRRIRTLFTTCHLAYTHDDACAYPMHTLLGEAVHGLGGSERLMVILNRLGIISSITKVRQHELERTYMKLMYGHSSTFTPGAFAVTSVDNVDIASPFATVKADGIARGIHATSYQLVEPQPTSNLNTSADYINGQKPTEEPRVDIDVPKHITVKDIDKLRKERQPQVIEWEKQRYQRPHGNVGDFVNLSTEEQHSLDEAKSCLLAYCIAKESQSDHLVFPDINIMCPVPENVHVEKSNSFYLGVLNEHADNIQTMKKIVEMIREEVVVPQNLCQLIVVGDGKTFEHLVRLKHEYSQELKWMVPFPGDWHALKNLQPVLMKVFWHAGLCELATTCHRGATLTAVVQCSSFRRTHDFIILAWEALLRVQLIAFLQHLEAKGQPYEWSNLLSEVAAQLKDVKQIDADSAPQLMLKVWKLMGESSFSLAFEVFRKTMREASETYQLWDNFVHRDGMVYILFFLAIRTGDWQLRLAALKLMAPLFHAFDRSTYMRLVPRHLGDVLGMESSMVSHLAAGGFVASISGTPNRSVGHDENHEMMINKEIKMSTRKPVPSIMDRLALYLPERAKAVQNLLAEVGSKNDNKGSINIAEMKNMEKKCKKFIEVVKDTDFGQSSPTGLKKELCTFGNTDGDTVQRQDMLRFYDVGMTAFRSHVATRLLYQSVEVGAPIRKKQLKTFLPKKKRPSKTSLAEKNKKLMNRCLRKMMVQSKTSGEPIPVLGQFIELPLAIALPTASCPTGVMVHGDKANTTKVFRTRYSSAFTDTYPVGWLPQCVILEGMFLINSGPSNAMRTFRDYTMHLLTRFVTPRFMRGAKEVHVVFDHPGRNGNSPKNLERQRRDATFTDTDVNVVLQAVICPETPLPKEASSIWRDVMLNNRANKRKLANFLSMDLLSASQQFLEPEQKLITAGGYDEGLQDMARGATSTHICDEATFSSNHEESDSRVWLHCLQSQHDRVLVFSPDTDTYHIGLVILCSDEGRIKKEAVVQLSDKQDKHEYLSINSFISCLRSDPDVDTIEKNDLPAILQTLFICSGCDYTSFFFKCGKSTFLTAFFQYAVFITGPTYGGTLRGASLSSEDNLLAFFRLVGAVYYKKFRPVMPPTYKTPEQLYQSFHEEGNARKQHEKWLDCIRESSWEKIESEAQVMPSNHALEYHWQRCCWVGELWAQADQQIVTVPTLHDHGYTVDGDGNIGIKWDSKQNQDSVSDLVGELLRGCKCKSGCVNKRCKCFKSHKKCGAGCECTNCGNPHNTGGCGSCPGVREGQVDQGDGREEMVDVLENRVDVDGQEDRPEVDGHEDRADQVDSIDEQDYIGDMTDDEMDLEEQENEEMASLQPDDIIYEYDGYEEDEFMWDENEEFVDEPYEEDVLEN